MKWISPLCQVTLWRKKAGDSCRIEDETHHTSNISHDAQILIFQQALLYSVSVPAIGVLEIGFVDFDFLVYKNVISVMLVVKNTSR
jgi:hypothetical protein